MYRQVRQMESKSGRGYMITIQQTEGPPPGTGRKGTKPLGGKGRRRKKKAPLLLMAVSTVPREQASKARRKSKSTSRSTKGRSTKRKKSSGQLSLL